MDKLPICIAKTQYSLSDNEKLLGKPENFTITIKELRVSNGAGFIVALAGSIMTMPGLPKTPAANNMDITEEGEIVITTEGVAYDDGIELSDETGFVKGPQELHNISKALYSNSELGIEARSMTIEDLNAAVGITDPKTDENVTYYGNKYAYYPNGTSVSGMTDGYTNVQRTTILSNGYTESRFYAWDDEDGNPVVSTDENTYKEPTADEPVKVTGTYYEYYPDELGTTNSSTVSDILGDSYGWLASPCIGLNSSYAVVSVRCAYSSSVSTNVIGLAHSDGLVFSSSCGLRPVIVLSSKLDLEGKDVDGAWMIK